ncbi:MAG: hypothetical protein LBH22_06170 [Bacteroidales bacterium]|nr:hypothetical protein [Bacteroidales bacterium]
MMLRLPLHFWYGEWKNILSNVDIVIVCSARGIEPIVEYIMSKNRNVRIILWYWDPVSRTCSPELFDRKRCEIWSFDPIDCETYDMNYNTTFYFNDIQLPHKNIIYDVCFVGYDKGRRKEIKRVEQMLTNVKCKTNFYIVDDDAAKRNYKGTCPLISYEKTLEYIAESKAILDILQDNQVGLTVRSMEALFFKKKLITTQVSIKTQDFYHPDNIFILDIDNIEDFPSFLGKPYVETPRNIVENYDFANWIRRFDQFNHLN